MESNDFTREYMMGDWTFFSNYGHVLVCLARNNEARLRDVAAEVGITERAAQKIVKDLQVAGFLTISKHGRRNRYQINKRKSLRHGLESHCNVGKLLALIAKQPRASRAKAMPEPAPVIQPTPLAESAPTKEVGLPAPPPSEKPAVADSGEEAAVPDTREQGSLF